LLEVHGQAFQRHFGDSIAVLVRGNAVVTGSSHTAKLTSVVDFVSRHYRQTGELPVDHLEGSFTLALLDGRAGRVMLYRNLVGNGFTYYTVMPDGLLFGSNLADLVDRSETIPQPNTVHLPVFFLFRFIPGRNTLFDGFYRLMAGEQIIFDAQGLRRTQRHTFADLKRPVSSGPDAVDRIEETMQRILAGYAATQPRTANLLSGGVDSSYLQAIWNRVRPAGEGSRLSYSVSVDHERTRIDTDYALSAARILGARHTLVPATAPYGDYLLETIAATGEPPNHAMTVYFGFLARHMAARNFAAALCGEGADSLFGISAADVLRTAQVIRRWLPWPRARRCGAALARAAGRYSLPAAFRLADFVDDWSHWQHPANQVAVFADWPAVRACFGDHGISAALTYRRELLEHYAVGDQPLERLHAIAYLGEAVDSASLWTTLFNNAGADLCCPYLDSRLLGLVHSIQPRYRFPYRRPKDLLKRALSRHAPRALAYRFKLGFGQPVFDWMAPGEQLRPWVDEIGEYDFVDRAARATALARPSWFLYSLLCYDLWHKLFIERSLPRHECVAASSSGQILPSLVSM
jgi:asparagine synthase (glutamine-hydrolysing)